MIPAVAMALLCVGQIGSDWNFEAAQERFAYEASRDPRGGVFRLERVVPHRVANWIRMLDCESGPCREEAFESLKEHIADPLVRRAIAWGQMPEVRSASIRFFCESLKYQFYVCRVCDGTGLCPRCNGTGRYPFGPGYRYCTTCHRNLKGLRTVYPTLCPCCRGSGTPTPRPEVRDEPGQPEWSPMPPDPKSES
jgi:hypothetical protein